MALMSITVSSDGGTTTAGVTLEDDQRDYQTARGKVKGADLIVGDMVCVMSNQGLFEIVSIP
jgi:hypothetical protein